MKRRNLTEGEFARLNLPELGSTPAPKRKVAKPTRKSMLEARAALLRKAGWPEWEIAIKLLMERSKLAWGWTIEPEQRICIEFADRMRIHVIQGTYYGIWGHCPNEGLRSKIVAAILRAMGMISGCADYSFMWVNLYNGAQGRGVMECKVPGGQIQETQKLYKAMCDRFGISHAYFHSADEGEEILRGWGAIHAPQKPRE